MKTLNLVAAIIATIILQGVVIWALCCSYSQVTTKWFIAIATTFVVFDISCMYMIWSNSESF